MNYMDVAENEHLLIIVLRMMLISHRYPLGQGVDANQQGRLHLIFTHLTDPHHPKDNRGQTLIFSKLNIVHVRLLSFFFHYNVKKIKQQ